MVKPWLAHYPEGVPEFISPMEYDSLADFFEQKVKQFGDKPAFSNMGASLSYTELEEHSRNFASYLQALDLQPKTRIAIKLPNTLQYPIVLLGVIRAGMIAVNTNPLYTGRELLHQLDDSGARVIIVLDHFIDVFQAIQTETKVKHTIVTSLGDMLPWPKSTLTNFVVKHIKKLVPPYDYQQTTRFNEALNIGKQLSFTPPVLNHDDTAFLQYTGGTTGLSKGAMLSHGNMLSNMQQVDLWITHGSPPETTLHAGEEIVITALPLYHIFALTANFFCFIDLGAENILITNPRDMPGFVKILQGLKFSCITGVNTLFDGLIHTPGFDQIDFSSLKLSIAGGMATRKSLAHSWKELTGSTLIESYGLTESSPAVTINPLDIEEFSGSIGQPLPSTECEIRDKKGRVLAIGETGELYIRGPQVMQGFWKQPEDTANEISPDGWLKTGDIVRMDERGMLYLVDREKDMILVSGFNVYPNEVEAVVSHHPGVMECGAIGIPDPNSGEAIKVYVVKKNLTLDKETLIKYCRLNLTGYKIPKFIEFTDALPKTNVGKILRRELKNLSEEKAS